MIREVHKTVYADTLATGDIEKAYVLNVFMGSVILLSDFEIVEDEYRVERMKMSFRVQKKLVESTVEKAANGVRSFYPGMIDVESYDDENDAIQAFMNAYNGFYMRHYIISSDVAIEEIRRLNDGILFIYIEGDADE